MIKVLSFDLQGTLSNAKFSDNFWMEIIPKKYAEKNNISCEEAKNDLRQYFKQIGIYDVKYYDDEYWSNKLGFNTINELNLNKIRPALNKKLFEFLNAIKLPKIIISTTTNLFIDYELGSNKELFSKTYSCVDNFKVGGKSSEEFRRVLQDLNIEPEEMLHIGDNYTMDVVNAKVLGINTILYNNNDEEVIAEIKKYLEV